MKKDLFDELVVVKRSGQRVNFNAYKIAVAIKNAFDNLNGKYNEKHINKIYEEVLLAIENDYIDRKTINVEDIQDIIENKLKEKKYFDVYSAFNEYRMKRANSRQAFSAKSQHKFARALEKIHNYDILRNDNEFLPKEILLNYGKIVTNEFSKSYIIDNKFLRNHEEGYIYIHDMEYFPLGIVSHTHLMLDEFLKRTRSFDETLNFIIDTKEEVSGEINVPAVDSLFEKYVFCKFKHYFKEYLTNYLKVFGFYEYINYKKLFETIDKEETLPIELSNYNNFILSSQMDNIFNSAYNDALEKATKLINRKLYKMLYKFQNNVNNHRFSISFGTNDSYIGKLISNELISNIREMEYLNKVSIIYKVRSKEDELLEEICELIVLSKNILISNNSSSYNEVDTEYFANGIRIYENSNDINTSTGRMIVATTSINMARLGFEYENKSKKQFYEALSEMLELVKNELLLTFEMIGNKSKQNYRILFDTNIFSYEKLEIGGKIRKVIKNGNLCIGLVGLNECVNLLCPQEDKREKFLLEIIKYINNIMSSFTTKTKLNFFICEPSDKKVRQEFIAFDKAIYGIRKGITDKKKYELLCDTVNDYKLVGTLQKNISGGLIKNIKIQKSYSIDKVKRIIYEIIDNDVGFVKFVFGDTL